MVTKDKLESIFQEEVIEVKENWKLLCPFHDERTPSFYIHQSELLCHCFGCGISGYLDTLVAKFLGVGLQRARELSGATFVDRLESSRTREVERRPKFFPESWLAPFERKVHKYVIDRGFTPDTIKQCGGRYDKSTQRQVFPHFNRDGKLLGVTGRSCTRREPKWLHYWDYDRGGALYAPFGYSPIRPLFVVEGVFDLLWLHQNGYSAVATLGNPSQAQIQELREYDELVFAFDNDKAGVEDTEKLYPALRRSAKISIVKWPVHVKDIVDMKDLTALETVNYVQWRTLRESKT